MTTVAKSHSVPLGVRHRVQYMEVVERILALSLEHPAWGCTRLSDMLKFQGVSVSSPILVREAFFTLRILTCGSAENSTASR